MKVKIARIKMGMTQEQLCGLLGISKTTLIKVEKGNYDFVRIGLAKKISEILEIPVQELFFQD